ncbi:ANTAR domain-containing protein (plasmid) [Klebsiella michiganensis]|uniref:ANTAR domain-containing response regulator n=1 Tax=Klebsiella michiganensis TaxID=1134687 RepID=UPI002658F48A|nr:ANTAR domain-containing protein [Klebsiella michiganensis]WKJ95808.1 ANTAR domain-containing protein [Klebsiella michiganensis]WKK01053.1 ANTAR domain-containing protein [Klebsiella michiganensis]WKK02846.1 ANTAR domain-containing protein [Klebsiella michiganensis]WKK07032.1 ANTAR domain-containing protein [Klebsiella michiganensis]
MNESSLLTSLAGVRLHIFHPDSQSLRAFCASLMQFGCYAQHNWPPVADLPADRQLLLVAIENHHEAVLKRLFCALQHHHTPTIALANCHDARLFPLLLKLKPTAIAERELNPFALIVQMIGIWQYAQQQVQFRHELQACQQCTARNERLAQAKRVLMQNFGLDESGAYRLMRTEAMNTRSSLECTARRVLNQLDK